MSDIITLGDHCALILDKEEAALIYALVGKPCGCTLHEATRVFRTFYNSEFVSWNEYIAWWNDHEIKAKKDLECKAGDTLPAGSITIVRK